MVALAVVLLVVNTAIDYKERPPKEKIVNELSVNQIEKVFFKVLDDYGIESNWISKKKFKSAVYDSAKVEYFVKLPEDLPIPLIIKEINQVIEEDITGFVSDEKKMYSTTEIRIYTNEVLKLKATLIPDQANIRNRSDLSFIITDACDLSEKNFRQFLSVYLQIAALIVPDKDNLTVMDSLKKYSKEYAVMINNDIDDNEMKLNPEYSKVLLHGSILNIVNKFDRKRAYIIDENSKIFRSGLLKYVKNDFRDQEVILYPRSKFINMNLDEDSELISKFKTQCNDTTEAKQKIFLIPFENFLKLTDLIEKFKKKGNKIIPLSKTDLFRKLEN
jgi:hypothetical protein